MLMPIFLPYATYHYATSLLPCHTLPMLTLIDTLCARARYARCHIVVAARRRMSVLMTLHTLNDIV